MGCGARHADIMEAMQIARDSTGPKSIPLSQVEDLGNDSSRGGVGRAQWSSGSIAQTGLTVTLVPGFPFVEGFAREPVASAGLSDPSRHLIGLPQELQAPGYQSIQFILVHGLLLGWERSQNVTLDLGLHRHSHATRSYREAP